ncbi:MAG TPA: calcium-binding protein [Actinoplanes sp.]|nr:calcium-binding protein [Actinoplanes sp.]
MNLINRRALALIGATAAAIGTAAFLSAPAQAAAATGTVKLASGDTQVVYKAAAGKANAVTIAVSGSTIVIDDKVALKPASAGCQQVAGDKTRVRCKITSALTSVSVTLGDKNDAVVNKTAVRLSVSGGAGNDTIFGGGGADSLRGGAGNDKIYGLGGADKIFGGAGNDKIYGGAGDDEIEADSGNDVVSAGAGDDIVQGWTGNDTLIGGAGHDVLIGESINTKNFRPVGNAKAKDKIFGNGGIDLALALKGAKTNGVEARTIEKWFELLDKAGVASTSAFH